MTSMLKQIAAAHRSALMRLSESYHQRKTLEYWASAPATHRDMSPEVFDFYASRIAAILGDADASGLVLDHGAGRGEVGARLIAMGYRVELSEYSPAYMDEIRRAGLICHAVNAVPEKRYNTIFANNALYLEHMNRFGQAIDRLLGSLLPGGRLFVLDVPVIQRMNRLEGSRARRWVWRWTRVFQPNLGGFFMDEDWFRAHYPGCRISDSWSDYRAHIEIPS